MGLGQHGRVLIVRATKKLLDRIGPPNLGAEEQSTTLTGQWYATAVGRHSGQVHRAHAAPRAYQEG